MRKDILVLHGMGPRNTWFSGVADIELMFPLYDLIDIRHIIVT